MFSIKTVIDKGQSAKFLKDKGVDIDIEDKFVMAAWQDGEFCGVGVAIIEPDYAEILIIKCENNLDSLVGKALLNSFDLSGIKKVIYKNKDMYELIKKLGFKKNNNDIMELNLEGYFGSSCNH